MCIPHPAHPPQDLTDEMERNKAEILAAREAQRKLISLEQRNRELAAENAELQAKRKELQYYKWEAGALRPSCGGCAGGGRRSSRAAAGRGASARHASALLARRPREGAGGRPQHHPCAERAVSAAQHGPHCCAGPLHLWRRRGAVPTAAAAPQGYMDKYGNFVPPIGHFTEDRKWIPGPGHFGETGAWVAGAICIL